MSRPLIEKVSWGPVQFIRDFDVHFMECNFIYLSAGEWIKKMRYISTMEYYSVIKKNEIGISLASQWLRLCLPI